MLRSRSLIVAVIVLLAGLTLCVAQSINWVQLSPAHSPSPRYWPAMAYDPVSRQLLLFGGMTASGTINDTWLFDGTDWTQLQTSSAPLPRYGAAMQFDRVIRKLVLFGGTRSSDGFTFSDTWLWDGASRTWTKTAPVHHPQALVGPMGFTDPAGGHFAFFGGEIKAGPYSDNTYRWTGTDWTKLNPRLRPQARAFGSLALDHDRNIVVLYGGLPQNVGYNTWIWDGTNWTEQTDAAQPPYTIFSAAAYDRAIQQVVTFGGSSGFNHNLTWGWDGSNWLDLAPAVAPSPRSKMALALDTALNRVILFGGTPGIGEFLGDTWELVP